VARIAGSSVLALRTYLEQRHGDRAFERAVDHLPDDEGAAMRSIILPVNWYPVNAFLGVLHAAHATWGGEEFYEEYGAFAAEYEIATFQRWLLRFTTPAFLVDRAGRLWHRFHDSGEWDVEGSGNRLRGSLRSFCVVDAGYCRVVGAWIKRAGEMTGVRGEVQHTVCRSRGADVEVFEGWWR
jgi:hypothetical protein